MTTTTTSVLLLPQNALFSSNAGTNQPIGSSVSAATDVPVQSTSSEIPPEARPVPQIVNRDVQRIVEEGSHLDSSIPSSASTAPKLEISVVPPATQPNMSISSSGQHAIVPPSTPSHRVVAARYLQPPAPALLPDANAISPAKSLLGRTSCSTGPMNRFIEKQKMSVIPIMQSTES